MISVALSPDIQVIVLSESLSDAPVPNTLSELKIISLSSESLPTSVNVAPGSSSPPPTACLLIRTSVLAGSGALASSNIVITVALFSPVVYVPSGASPFPDSAGVEPLTSFLTELSTSFPSFISK